MDRRYGGDEDILKREIVPRAHFLLPARKRLRPGPLWVRRSGSTPPAPIARTARRSGVSGHEPPHHNVVRHPLQERRQPKWQRDRDAAALISGDSSRSSGSGVLWQHGRGRFDNGGEWMLKRGVCKSLGASDSA
jgi:hypothetical protein